MEHAEPARRARPRRVLVVCTGNVSRSPLTAGLLAAALPAARFEVVSRGTRAPERAPADAVTIAVAAAEGIDLSAHASQRLTAADLELVDLVITHERQHAERIAELEPRLARRVIRLRQLARVADAVGRLDGTPRDRIASLLASRGLVAGADLDVLDPVERSTSEQRAIAEAIVVDVGAVVRALVE